jgi:hypothetical protein
MGNPHTRAEKWAPYFAGALFAIPVLLAKYPPMDDLPLHEASVGLLRHWGDLQFAPRGLYYLNLGHANQLFSFLIYALSFLVPIGWASKIVVASAVFALPVAAAHFADHIGSPRWTALLAAPVGLGWLFFWGLIQNIIGLGALLALLPAIDRFASRPTGKRAAWMCVAMVFLHFAHQVMQLVALASLILCSIGVDTRADPRAQRLRLRAIPAVFCMALVVAENRYSWYLSGPRHKHAALFVFYTLEHKVLSIPGVLFGGYEPYVRNLMLLLGLLPMTLLLAARWQSRSRVPRAFFERVHARRFDLLGIGLFIVYLVAPANFQSTTLIYHRFLPTAWAILAVCAGMGQAGGSLRLPVRMLCCVLPVASVLISWPVFADSNQIYVELEPLIDQIDIGSPIVVINLGPQDPHRLWNPLVAGGHIVAVRGGRDLFDYTISPISPVTQRAEKQWIDPVDRLETDPMTLRPDWDLKRFRYLLINTTKSGLGTVIAMALRDEVTLKAANGSWYLYESRLPLVAFDADDAHFPEPHPPTLRKKLRELAAQLDAANPETANPHGQQD